MSESDGTPAFIEAIDGGVRLRIKAVPGARREAIAGELGDRLKVRISAPPEGGKANAAIEALLADALGVRARDVSVVSGRTNPEKIVEAMGVDLASAIARLRTQ